MLATLWLALLFVAAPAFGRPAELLAARVRGALVLGVAIPFVLGFLGLLYGTACFAVAGCCAFVSLRRRRAPIPTPVSLSRVALIPIAAVLLVAWPQIVRPPLDGDTLAYHLPNALSWAHAHSVWVTNTRYWWYPGGSELFAAGFIAVGAPWAVPLAGLPAALLVALRISSFTARVAGANVVAAALIGAAFVTMPLAAFQTATLQNDLWLAAALLEVLWILLYGADRWWETAAVIALCTLIKPSGWIVALIALLAALVARRKVVGVGGSWGTSGWAAALLGFLPLLLWALRDALLSPSAIVPISSAAVPWLWRSTIASHGVQGMALLSAAVLRAGPVALASLLATLCVALWPRCLERGVMERLGLPGDAVPAYRAVAVAGVLVFALFVLSPFGFVASVPQLANGASLRMALPTMACGAALLGLFSVRYALAAGTLAALCALVGVLGVLGVFRNDAVTLSTLPVVLCALALLRWCLGGGTPRAPARTVVSVSATRNALPVAALLAFIAMVLAVAGHAAASRAVAFYSAGMTAAPSGAPTHLFTALARLQPQAVVALDVRAGAIGMVSPRTTVYDAFGAAPCALATRMRAALVLGTDLDVDPAVRAERRALALTRCGRVLYRDAAAVIASPVP
ncbi:MAG: hypothetical protein KGM44_08580 [bacterium]|nr:hypothetical protein [bacterium]